MEVKRLKMVIDTKTNNDNDTHINTETSSYLQEQWGIIKGFEGKIVPTNDWRDYMDAVAVPIVPPKRANRRIQIKIRGL